MLAVINASSVRSEVDGLGLLTAGMLRVGDTNNKNNLNRHESIKFRSFFST